MKNARGVPGRNVYINVNESSGWAGFVTLRADFGQVRRKNWPIWVPIFGRGQKLEVRADKFGLGLAGLLPLRPERRPPLWSSSRVRLFAADGRRVPRLGAYGAAR